MNTMESPMFRTANHEVVLVEGIGPLFICMGNLRLRACIGVVQKFPVDGLLGTPFIDCGIRGLIPVEQKFVPWHS